MYIHESFVPYCVSKNTGHIKTPHRKAVGTCWARCWFGGGAKVDGLIGGEGTQCEGCRCEVKIRGLGGLPMWETLKKRKEENQVVYALSGHLRTKMSGCQCF